MSTDRPAVPLARVRDLLEQRVGAGSIRSVAREVGLPPNGLKYFLDGGEPRTATVRKLEVWYIREAARRAGQPDDDAGRAALAILARYVPPTHRPAARDRLGELLQDLCAAAGVPVPSWLSEPDSQTSAG